MVIQLLAPGVQDQAQAQLAAQAMTAELQQALRGAVEEQLIEPRRVEPEQGVEFGGQGENAVIVGDRQQTALLVVEPLPTLGSQALWAMAVAAGTAGPMLLVTVRTKENVGAQLTGAATGQPPEQTTPAPAQVQSRFQGGQELAQEAAQRIAGSLG